MNHDDRRARQLQRLEEAQRRATQRLEQRRTHTNARFEKMRRSLTRDQSSDRLSKEKIITAALALNDEVGLNDLTLRKLAATLDIQAPALYWYFKSKDELIDYMAEQILHEAFHDLVPRTPNVPWQEWLIATCHTLRNAMRAHKNGARIVAGAHFYPAVTLVRLFEIAMQSLVSAGIDLRRANLIVSTAVHFVFGNVIEEQAAPSYEQVERFDSSTLGDNFPLVQASIELTLADMRSGYDEFEDSLRLIIHE